MKKMLIDAAHAEETRVILLDGSRIDDFESENIGKQQHKGNIYIGTVSRVEPSLQAAFITYGGNRNGFLAFGETHPQHFALKPAEKAALLEELAEQAARRRTDDEAEAAEFTPTEAKPERNNRPARRGRPQRISTDGAAPTAETETTEGEAAPATETTEAPTPSFYEDPEDAAAARKAAAMADAMERGEQPSAQGKGQGKGGRKPGLLRGKGRPAKAPKQAAANPESQDNANGNVAEGTSAAQKPAGNKRRPKRMEARRPARVTEATAEGMEPEAVSEHAPVEAIATEAKPERAPRHHENSEERNRVSGVSHGSVHRRYRIQDVLKEGQKILVQVVKEERGSKGAALTTYISLPGRYTVLMPNTPNAGGISRKITDGEERRALRDTYRALDVPSTMGLIIRTAGMGQEIDAIKTDYANLQQLWSHITQEFEAHDDVQCLHEDGSIIVRALRDMAGDDVDEIVISGQRAYKQAKDFAKAFIPEALKKISLYKEEDPILSHYGVESKLIHLHHERVQLPSGGSIVINPTEALVAIDINSGRNTSERNIEETAYKTNLEACEEIARQIRLRDLAGLIVVDFIDMESYGNTRKIEQAMRRALKRDRARIQTASISEFGLMEISRQRLRPSFAENHTVKCTCCGGTGRMVSSSSAGLMLLRRLEEADVIGSDRVTVCATTATVLWVLNHKRELIRTLEEKYKYLLVFKADDTLLVPDARLELTRMKSDGSETSQIINVEWREQAEVPPEKRYTKEGRAQRQREEEVREDMRSSTPERTEGKERTERAPRPERPARAPREERAPRAEATTEPAAPKAEKQGKVAKQHKPEATAKPTAKPATPAEDKPLAVVKVEAERGSSPAVQPKAKPKMALKVQPDTDRDVSPIAVAKVEADRSQEATSPKARPKTMVVKAAEDTDDTPKEKPARKGKAAEKGILNRLLGL